MVKSLTKALIGYFDKPFAELPPTKRRLFEKADANYLKGRWDRTAAARRRSLCEQIDTLNRRREQEQEPRKVQKSELASFLSVALHLWFRRPVAELPSGLQERIPLRFRRSWDMMSPDQRKTYAAQIDAPSLPECDIAFRKVNRKIVNRQNARRQRPTRQSVPDAAMIKVRRDLAADGVKPHKQISEAYRRLRPQISLRGFRKRWSKVKKKGT